MSFPFGLRRPVMLGIMLVLGLLSLFYWFWGPVNSIAAPKNGPSIMIIGDSISQGRNEDFTWRYRLWEWFHVNDLSVKFVGPYTGTVQQESAKPLAIPLSEEDANTTPVESLPVRQLGGYNRDIPSKSPFFSAGRYHFAAWGRQIAQDMELIEGMVARYKPDYLLVELGFNDLGWFATDAFGTLQNVATFVKNARAAKPDIAFAIANIPQRSFIGGREDLIAKTDAYNEALPSLLDHMSTDESPIRLVQLRDNYDCHPEGCPAGSDGLHPNALGEFQIAKAFADTLSQGFNWPGAAFSIPSTIPVRECTTPTNVVAKPTSCGVTVSWDAVDGAYEYILQFEYDGGAKSKFPVSGPMYTTGRIVAGITWNYQVQAVCSDVVSDMSKQVSIKADPDCVPDDE